MEIDEGEGEVLRERSLAIQDAQHRTPGTMRSHPHAAPAALTTRDVDLAADPLSQPAGIWTLNHLRHELMAGHAREVHIAAAQLEIGGADSCHPDAQEHLS